MIQLEHLFRALHCKNGSANLFEVIRTPLLSVEQPYLLILHRLHTFDTRYPEQCIALAINVGNEDIILNKGMTMFCEGDRFNYKTPHTKEMVTVNIVKDKDMKDIKRERIQNWNNNRKKCHKILTN